MTKEELKKAKKAYSFQKSRAINSRGIEFNLTFDEWLNWWLQTGHWHERGHGSGKYVMSRFNDIGPYSLDNIFCQTLNANTSESAKRLKGIPKPIGFGENISKRLKGVPKNYEVWNKGTIGIQKSGMEGKHHTLETKKKIGSKNSKAIMTPEGRFESRSLAAKHFGITPEGMGARVRYYPTEYYYL